MADRFEVDAEFRPEHVLDESPPLQQGRVRRSARLTFGCRGGEMRGEVVALEQARYGVSFTPPVLGERFEAARFAARFGEGVSGSSGR